MLACCLLGFVAFRVVVVSWTVWMGGYLCIKADIMELRLVCQCLPQSMGTVGYVTTYS